MGWILYIQSLLLLLLDLLERLVVFVLVFAKNCDWLAIFRVKVPNLDFRDKSSHNHHVGLFTRPDRQPLKTQRIGCKNDFVMHIEVCVFMLIDVNFQVRVVVFSCCCDDDRVGLPNSKIVFLFLRITKGIWVLLAIWVHI